MTVKQFWDGLQAEIDAQWPEQPTSYKRQLQPTGCIGVTVTVDAIDGFRGDPRQIPVTLHIRHPNGACDERVVYCGDEITLAMPSGAISGGSA